MPLILGKHEKKEHFLFGKFSVRARHPIRMDLNFILKYHNFEPTENLEFHEVPRGVALVKVENNVAFTDGETTGLVDGDLIIGKNGPVYYWIPDKNIIQKRYYCTKYPGKCHMFFIKKCNLDDHMIGCTDHTTIISKQVCLNIAYAAKKLINVKVTQTGENFLAEAIQMGYLPESFMNYRQKYLAVWDIETLESENDDSRVEAFLNIVSVR